MSTNKADTIHALCLAHRIAQYEAPPPDKYIQIKYTNRTLQLSAHIILQVSHEVINCVSNQDLVQSNAPAGGWKTTPTPVIRLRMKHEYVTRHNPRTGVIFHQHACDGVEAAECFHISARGEEHHHVKSPTDQYCMRLKKPNEIVINIETMETSNEEFAYDLGEKAIILMDVITFDKNM
jgi:hypothetical protein